MNDTQGSIEYVARINTKNLKSDAAETESIIDGVGKKTEDSAGRGEKSFVKMGAVIGAVAGVVEQVLGRAIDGVNNLLGDAIARVDTLNNSDRTFKNMGFSVDDTRKTIEALDKSIRGLPTPLDEAIRQVTKISASINDLPKSQRVFSALNNAIIGFGGTTDDVRNSVTQLSQELGTGRITAQTWLSLTNSGLTPALAAMARQMGITTKELKEGLGEGTISADKFMDSLIELNEKGGGGMQSFEKIAKDATAGIQTGFANMRTAIVRGMSEVIKTIGSGNISASISSIGSAFESTLKGIASFTRLLIENRMAIIGVTSALATLYTALQVRAAVIAMQAALVTLRMGFIASTVATLGFSGSIGVATTAMRVFLASIGPVGWAIGAVSIAVGFLVPQLISNKTAADSLKNANNALKTSLDAVKTASDNLKNSQLGLSGAQLNLESAQRTYNDAVRQYGPASLEARQALQQVKQAEYDVKTAQDRVKESSAELKKQQDETAKNKSALEALERQRSAFGQTAAEADRAAESIRKFVDANLKGQKQVSVSPGNTAGMNALKAIQGRASGGSISANTPYLVGENRDGSINDTTELFVPGRSGSIMNSKDLQAALGGSGGGVEYNIGTINISKEVDGERWLRRLNANQETVSNGLVPRQAYM